MVGIKLKGQVFTFDYIIGFVMFVIVAIIAGKQLINIIPSNSYDALYEENIYLSTTLLQPGYPDDWTPGDVLIPGIASNNRLSATKLSYFDSFTYDESKSFYHISYDFLFHFKQNDSIISINGECTHGYPLAVNATTCEPLFDSITYDNLVTSSRLVIYNSTIIEMELFSWG